MRRSKEQLMARMFSGATTAKPAPPKQQHVPREVNKVPKTAEPKVHCADCGGTDLYSFEFRTDNAKPRTFDAVNDGSEEIEPPYRFTGTYCATCGDAVSTKRGSG
jgi:hypothetical protein